MAERSRLAGAEEVYLKPEQLDQALDLVSSELNNMKVRRFVDLGSGNGRVLRYIKKQGGFYQVLGIEKFWLLRVAAKLRGQNSIGQDLRSLDLPNQWREGTLYYGFLRRDLAIMVLSSLGQQVGQRSVVLFVVPEEVSREDLMDDWEVIGVERIGGYWGVGLQIRNIGG